MEMKWDNNAHILRIGSEIVHIYNFVIFVHTLKNYKTLKIVMPTVFENHRKSLIQYCERSELRLHFE